MVETFPRNSLKYISKLTQLRSLGEVYNPFVKSSSETECLSSLTLLTTLRINFAVEEFR